MTPGGGCTVRHVFVEGRELTRLVHDSDGVCHDCYVGRGEYHHVGCDAEVCPWCGGQLISCDCPVDEDDRNPAALLAERRNARQVLDFARREQEVRELAARSAAADQIADADRTLANQIKAAILEWLTQTARLDLAQAHVSAWAKREPQHAAAFDSLEEMVAFIDSRDEWQSEMNKADMERTRAYESLDRAVRRAVYTMPNEMWVRFEEMAIGCSHKNVYRLPWSDIEAARERIDTHGFYAPFKDTDTHDDDLPF